MRLPDNTSLRRLPLRGLAIPARDEADEKWPSEVTVTDRNIFQGQHDWITLSNPFGT